MSNLLDGLNERQHEAVTAGTGPVMVLAGPGSGKTRGLTYRIAYLIEAGGIPASSIVAVTFTNKAAGEMRERVGHLLGGRVAGLQIGTFHALCARLLRREGQNTPFGPDYVIYDTEDQLAVIKQTLSELNIDPKKYNPRRVLGKISEAKNELIQPAQFTSLDYFGEVVGRAYPRYQSILLDNNALDFDDLLMQMVLLLEENDSVREKYQRLFEFVLVDEFQDTNTAQYRLVKLLGQPQNNVFVVGDEDQAIYGFRGADYRNVMRFREDYPDAQVCLLEQNYRSTQYVLNAARAVIDRNPNRTPKALFTDRGDGVRIEVKECYNEDMEATWVVNTINDLCDDEDRTWSDFAVMYRTNAQSRALEDAFIREGLPYRLIGGVGFYKRREVRDLLAYLRLVNNPNDKVSFTRIVNVPRRGIGKKSLQDFQHWAATECENYDDALSRLVSGEATSLSGRSARLFAEFAGQVQRWREIAATGDLVNLMDRLMSDVGYNLYLREISDTDDQYVEREDNIQEMRGLLARTQADGLSLGEFLAEQSLVSDVDALAADADAVTLLTLHAAKGLEFPVVFITGVEEGMLPHMRSFEDPEGMAEERRLMYVGLTRTIDRGYLSYTFRRSLYGNSTNNLPSRFISDMPTSLIDGLSPRAAAESDIRSFREQTSWQPSTSKRQPNDKIRSKIVRFPGTTSFKTNDRVKHPIFGLGRVIESNNEHGVEMVHVVFEDKRHGIQEIDADYLVRVDK